MHLNYIDIIILGIILLFGIKGFYLGFIRSLFNLLKYIFSLVLCKLYFKPISSYILNNEYVVRFIREWIKGLLIKIPNNNIFLDAIIKGIIDIVIILGIFFISNLILGVVISFIESIFKFKPLKIINKLAGFIFGSMKGLIILLLILTLIHPLLEMFPKETLIIDLNNSLLLKYLYMYNFVFKYFNNLIEIFNKSNLTLML